MATSAATVVAAMAARARREVRHYFDERSAFDPAHAIEYDPPSPMHRRQLGVLIGRAIVRETGDGRYWFDREADRREQERQRQAAIAVLKVLLIVLVVVIAVSVIVAALK
jgi:hypothetical protein